MASTRTKKRGISATLSPDELSAHMKGVAEQRARYSEIGKTVVELGKSPAWVRLWSLLLQPADNGGQK